MIRITRDDIDARNVQYADNNRLIDYSAHLDAGLEFQSVLCCQQLEAVQIPRSPPNNPNKTDRLQPRTDELYLRAFQRHFSPPDRRNQPMALDTWRRAPIATMGEGMGGGRCF